MKPRFAIAGVAPLTLFAAAIAVVGALLLLLAAEAIVQRSPFDDLFVVGCFVPYAVGVAVMVTRISVYHPHTRFGAANVITLIRLIITSLSAGLVVEVLLTHRSLTPALMWFFFAVATLGLVLDAVDGRLARRQGLESPFGSRFDMEVDALQILLLAIIAFAMGKAGAWVLMSGALRYIYVAAGAVWPRLNGPLKPSWRRKTIAAIQSTAVTVLLAPIIAPPASTAIAAIALGLLVYSFAADVVPVVWPGRVDHNPIP
jgi:phosphatidylglycerophosphate synthase